MVQERTFMEQIEDLPQSPKAPNKLKEMAHQAQDWCNLHE
jgi:hypothetical protein